MSIFRRISATLIAGAEQTVSRIENQDAIIGAALADGRQAAARARSRLAQIQRDGDKLKQSITTLSQQATQWEKRAAEKKNSDHALALECMKRRKTCRQQLDEKERQLSRHIEVEQQARKALQDVEQRLSTIEQQRNQLRTRQSAADAQRIIAAIETSDSLSIDQSLARWEDRISEQEYLYGSSDLPDNCGTTDELEKQFVSDEESAELARELEALVNDGGE